MTFRKNIKFESNTIVSVHDFVALVKRNETRCCPSARAAPLTHRGSAAEMTEEDVGRERMPGRGLQDLLRPEGAALAVHVRPQPADEGREIAAREAGAQVGLGPVGGVEELAAIIAPSV